MGYLTAQWYGNHFPCNSHHSYLDDIIDMSDHEASNKKRSHSDSEAEEARDHVGPLRTNSTSARKKPRLVEEPRRPFASVDALQNALTRKCTPKNQTGPVSAPVDVTPLRASASDKVHHEGEPRVLDKHVKSFIKNELRTREDALIRDYPVVDFVRNVWGFRPESIPIGTTGYILKGVLVEAYEKFEYIKGKEYQGRERNACLAFEEIFEALVKQLETNNAEAGSPLSSSELNCELEFLRELIIHGNYANFKPDYGVVEKGTLKDRLLHWQKLCAIGEQKRKPANQSNPFRLDVVIDPSKLLPTEGAPAANNDIQPERVRQRRKGVPKKGRGRSQMKAGSSSKQEAVSVSMTQPASKEEDENEGDGVESMSVFASWANEAEENHDHQGKVGTDKEDHPESVACPSSMKQICEATSCNPLTSPNLSSSHVDTLTNDEIQIVKYLNELLSHGIRQHASGFLVEDQWISLWYADRYGVVKSTCFDWIKEPHFLLLMIAALRFADQRKLGFSPFVALDPKASNANPYDNATLCLTGVQYPADENKTTINNKGQNGTKQKDRATKRAKGRRKAKGKGMASAKAKGKVYIQEDAEEQAKEGDKDKREEMETPPPVLEGPLQATNGEGAPIEQSLKFPLDITAQRRLYTQYGIIGRGTTVIPVKVASGNVTAIALGLKGETPLVAKLAWQHVHRQKEDAFIRQIRKALAIDEDPQSQLMLKHVVNMLCSLSVSMRSSYIHLPRAFMSLLPDIHPSDMREFRLLLLEAYEPLSNITSADDFKKIFRETFQAHHWIWTKANVLHRDISVNNIMFRIRGDTVEGVLCDWDLSATKADLGVPIKSTVQCEDENEQNEEGAPDNDKAGKKKKPAQPDAIAKDDPLTPVRERPRYRTGTGPFMALELLYIRNGVTPVHDYTFDVQSFFYVMCWVFATHDPEQKTMGNIPRWMNKRLKATYDAKTEFLGDRSERDAVFRNAHPVYQPLIKSWVRPLVPMFSGAQEAWSSLGNLRGHLIDALEDNDEILERSTRAKIAAKEKELESIITYENFLERLV
ncbi:hypothetical protein K474DRAFT_1777198 [Panus rudis PR-1116 ss-1]|nr:hypothetical protein K474DRAFT_1777198 [Panus rudis PR-1116 ss-1]